MPITHRVSRFVISNDSTTSRPPPQLCIVLDVLFHLPHFANFFLEVYNDDGEQDSDVLVELKNIFDSAMTYGLETEIDIKNIFEKLGSITGKNYISDNHTLDVVLRDLTDQIMKLLPRLRNVFCGQGMDFSCNWLHGENGTRGLPMGSAFFTETTQTLEDYFRESFQQCFLLPEETAKIAITPPHMLVISVSSSHIQAAKCSTDNAPQEIKFPEVLDFATCAENPTIFGVDEVLKYDLVSVVSGDGLNFSRYSFYFRIETGTQGQEYQWYGGYTESDIESVDKSRAIAGSYLISTEAQKVHPRLLIYIRKDFSSILEGIRSCGTSATETVEFETSSRSSSSTSSGGARSSAFAEAKLLRDGEDDNEPLSSESETSGSSAPVVGVKSSGKRGLDSLSPQLCAHHAAEASQAKASGGSVENKDDSSKFKPDTENGKANHISASSPSSSSLSSSVGLDALALEEQADLALANRRLKEALDIYSKAITACGNDSSINSEHIRVLQDKRDRVSRLIKLDTSTQLIEKGERALSRGAFAEARTHYVKAAHNQSDILHIKTIIAEIDQCIKLQTASQKISEGHAAMRAGQYQTADELFRCAIALNPDKASALETVQASLIPLMKTENAQWKQRSGMQAFDEKRFHDALTLFTEAINLLPEGSSYLPTYFCDRASAHCELKDYTNAISNCEAALALQNDLGVAFFRLGTAYFGLEKLDEAYANYEKALKVDPSLSEHVKVKIRQVNSAREVQQRKEREAERAKQKEEEQKALAERRAKEEQVKKEKAEKAAIERAEKSERARLKEEETKAKKLKEKEDQARKDQEKELERERLRVERLEKDRQRAEEREKQKLEKEKERERLKKEKEQKAADLLRIAEEEKRRKDQFAAEIARVEQQRKEVEKEKEAEKERARLEMERIIAEREKARSEKINGAKSSSSTASSNASTKARTADENYVGSSSGSTNIGSAPGSTGNDVELCVKCREPLECEDRLPAFGHCNHKSACSLCYLRNRTQNLGEQDLTCIVCNVTLDHVVCSTSSQAFNRFQLPGNPGPDLTYDKKSRMFFPKMYNKSKVAPLWQYTCKVCDTEKPDLEALRLHLKVISASFIIPFLFSPLQKYIQTRDIITAHHHMKFNLITSTDCS